MKAKSLKTGEAELKRGDSVAVYQTTYSVYPATKRVSPCTYSSSNTSTVHFADGVVLRVYKHIGAAVVKCGFFFGGGTLFIKEDDSQWSFYIEEEK